MPKGEEVRSVPPQNVSHIALGLEVQEIFSSSGRGRSVSLDIPLYRTREQSPQGWATIQNNLGAVLDELAGRSEGAQAAEYLQQAVAAYKGALQVYTREQLPQDWAMTQNNLGNALANLAGRSEGAQAAEYLQQAVAAYQSALQVRTREQLPQDWAETQNNLGNTLRLLAVRSEGAQAAEYLQQAVAALKSALQVYTASDFPDRWAKTMRNLALAYESQGDWSNARQTYEALLRHDPNNASVQARLKELSQKH
jgi:tetratricopeptide (TPR) repeat protein